MKKQTYASKKLNAMIMGGFAAEFSVFLQMATDNIIAGHIIGNVGLQALTLLAPFITINAFASNLLSFGAEFLYSKSVGNESADRANKVFSSGFFMTIIVGLCLFLAMIAVKPIFFSGISAPENVITLVSLYYDYYKYVMILNPINFYLVVMVYCDGDPSLYGLSAFLQVIANIIISSLLGAVNGVEGLAIGTLIAICVSIAIGSIHFLKNTNTLKIVNYFNIADGIDMFKYSIASCISMFGWSVMSAVFTRQIMRIKGPDYIVVITVFLCVLEISEVFRSVINAMPPLVLSYIRNKCFEGVENTMKLCIRSAVWMAAAVNALLLAAPRLILLLYNISNEEIYPELILSVRIFSLMMIPIAVYNLISGYYIAIDKMIYGLFINICKDTLFPIALGLIAGEICGFVCMQWGIVMGVVLSGIICLYFIYLVNKENGFPYMSRLIGSDRCIFAEYQVGERNAGEIAYDIAEKLRAYNIKKDDITVCNFLIESYMQKLYDDNGHLVNAECIIDLSEGVRFIIRDDGKIDNFDSENKVDSFNEYAMYTVLEKYYLKGYYQSLSCNCHVLQLVTDRS